MRYKTKPNPMSYVEAVKDEDTGNYFAKEVDANGKGIRPVMEIAGKDFEARYDPLLRAPTTAKPKTPPAA